MNKSQELFDIIDIVSTELSEIQTLLTVVGEHHIHMLQDDDNESAILYEIQRNHNLDCGLIPMIENKVAKVVEYIDNCAG